jgi:hypothetical protein
MHHFKVVPVAAFRRTIKRPDWKPIRFGQAVSIGGIERVAAVQTGLDLGLGSHMVRVRAMALIQC